MECYKSSFCRSVGNWCTKSSILKTRICERHVLKQVVIIAAFSALTRHKTPKFSIHLPKTPVPLVLQIGGTEVAPWWKKPYPAFCVHGRKWQEQSNHKSAMYSSPFQLSSVWCRHSPMLSWLKLHDAQKDDSPSVNLNVLSRFE